MDRELKHYGTPRHSGRYPWGSGDNPYQRNVNFFGTVDKLRKQGVHDTVIAKSMNMTSTELRKKVSIANSAIKMHEASLALKLKDKGYSTSAIGRRLGRNESTIRGYLDPVLMERRNSIHTNAMLLKEGVERNRFIDVGPGTELGMGISKTKLDTAVKYLMQEEGFKLHKIKVPQLQGDHETTMMVLGPPESKWQDVMNNKNDISLLNDVYSEDGGKTLRRIGPPVNIDSSRVMVRYGDQGGKLKDGTIELRRGVDDISLGEASYAQVRIAVEGTHYMKGMALYSDDLPPGVDIVYNTNKPTGVPMMGVGDNSVMKPIKLNEEGKQINPENPFGATIKGDNQLLRAQRHYIDSEGVERQSALNIVNEEGDWNNWSGTLSSQFLSKQNPALAKEQLGLFSSIARDKLNEINELTNPTVKADLLNKFADQCDSDAVHLQAAALPRQSTKIILPHNSLNPNEIYAPSYNDGEKVALVRYPHGGIFEIPTLTVNNNAPEPKATLGTDIIDAVVVHPKVAEKLSGADFDGDFVVVIPVDNVSVKTKATLPGLESFEPKEAYRIPDDMKSSIPRMTSQQKGIEMGAISNLITDMTIKGATWPEIERAVKHSMVVIDAEKHYLDYERSAVEQGIPELKMKYQDAPGYGASTLISRSTSDTYIPERKEKAVSRMTPEEKKKWESGEKIYENTGRTKNKGIVEKKAVSRMTPEEVAKAKQFMTDDELKRVESGDIKGLKVATGETKWTKTERLETIAKGANTDDAYTLVSGSPDKTTRIESVYADHANKMKALAKEARKEANALEGIPRTPTAIKTYSKEIEELKAEIALAERNAPLERQALLIGTKSYLAKKAADPSLSSKELKRLKSQEMQDARDRIGAKRHKINISDRQWEAINAGAISVNMLKKVLNNSDPTRIKQLATPRSSNGMTSGMIASAKSMLKRGYSQADVARHLGIAVSTLADNL